MVVQFPPLTAIEKLSQVTTTKFRTATGLDLAFSTLEEYLKFLFYFNHIIKIKGFLMLVFVFLTDLFINFRDYTFLLMDSDIKLFLTKTS